MRIEKLTAVCHRVEACANKYRTPPQMRIRLIILNNTLPQTLPVNFTNISGTNPANIAIMNGMALCHSLARLKAADATNFLQLNMLFSSRLLAESVFLIMRGKTQSLNSIR